MTDYLAFAVPSRHFSTQVASGARLSVLRGA